MRPQTLVMLLVALGCGLGAMVMAQRYLSNSQSGPSSEQAEIFVATADLQPGDTLTEDKFKQVLYPKNLVPKDASTKKEEVLNRVAQFSFGPDDIIREGKLAKPGAPAGIQALVPPGMRAVTARIQTEAGVAGFIRPQSIVDISLYMQSSGSSPGLTKVILERVKVLAVNTNLSRQGEQQNQGQNVEMVTFLLNEDDAAKLTLAESVGRLKLVMRNADDKEKSKAKPLTVAQLLGQNSSGGQEPEEVAPPVASAPDKVEKEKVETKPGFVDGIAKGFSDIFSKGTKKDENEKEVKPDEGAAKVETVEPKIDTPPVVSAPTKKQVKLIYRDAKGNPVMEIMLDADSKLAESLKGLVEPVEGGEAGATGDNGSGNAPAPVKPEPKVVPKTTSPKKA